MRTKLIGEHCVNKFPYGSLNMSAATITPQRSFLMKNFTKFWGIIAVVAVIVFSVVGCWEVSDDSETGSIKVINNSSYDRWINVVDVKTHDPRREIVSTHYIKSGRDWTFTGLSVDRNYYIAVTDRPEYAGVTEYGNILYSSSSFSIEKGKTVKITFNGWNFY
jgi:hypothetical protein